MALTIRTSVAGRFYPAGAGQLRRDVEAYLAAAPAVCRPLAIISPHAGYGYSGSIAGHAYKSVQSVCHPIRRVLLLGTCHAPGVRGLATTSATTMVTPLGEIPVDRQAVDLALTTLVGEVNVNDDAHASDHSLQTQLPFLQVVLDSFSVAPFLVGSTDEMRVCNLITMLGNSSDALTVVSSDLSHYLDYDTCHRVDRHTAESIAALDAESITPKQACGYRAIRGLIQAATELRWVAQLLALKNSGDVSGDRSRVVGYGAFALEQLQA